MGNKYKLHTQVLKNTGILELKSFWDRKNDPYTRWTKLGWYFPKNTFPDKNPRFWFKTFKKMNSGGKNRPKREFFFVEEMNSGGIINETCIPLVGKSRNHRKHSTQGRRK